MRRADITPVYKNDPKSVNSNYRPGSILSNIFKLYERIMFKKISEYFESYFFSKYQCRFRKGFSAMHSIVSML